MCMPVWLHAIYWQGWCIFKCETTKRNYLKTYRKALLSKNLFIWCNILSNTCVIYIFENFLCSSPKTKSFQETQISFPEWNEHQIFLDPQLHSIGVFGYHWNIHFFKKTVCPKNVWMRHCADSFILVLYRFMSRRGTVHSISLVRQWSKFWTWCLTYGRGMGMLNSICKSYFGRIVEDPQSLHEWWITQNIDGWSWTYH